MKFIGPAARGRGRALGASAIALALVTSACGSAATPASGTVAVGLQEWAVLPAQSSVNAGKVTFNVSNKGPDDPHELVIIKTDLGPDKLPTDADGKVEEEGAGIEFIGEIESFDPGKSETATFDLAPGKYVLICNILQDKPDGSKEAHYRMGMLASFTVD